MTAPLPLSMPLAVRFLLDAQEECARVIDYLPAPARGGPLGRLSAPGWVVAHLAFSHDLWINVLAAGGAPDAWVSDWRARQTAATLDDPMAPPLDEARDAFLAVAGRAAIALAACDETALAQTIDTPRGASSAGYLVARAAAHLFAHGGELAVIGSLVGADDPGLPGELTSTAASAAPERAADAQSPQERHPESHPLAPPLAPPLMVRLLLDAHAEFARAAEALPLPARHGAVERLNPGGFTVAHVANREDRLWCATAQRRARDPWLAAAPVWRGAPRSAPPFDAALAAYRRAVACAAPYLEGLRAPDLAGTITDAGSDRMLGVEIARSAGHLFAHAGELVAIGSLFGGPDLGLPGMLERTAGG